MTNNQELGDEISITVPIYMETEIECDNEGVCKINTLVYPDKEASENEDPSAEVTVNFEDLIAGVIEYYQEENNADGRNGMYCIAHELSRQAEILRNKADIMDRGVYSDDLFDEEKVEPESFNTKI